MPNLYLVGMMGSGKTVTGEKLAGYLKRPFLDLDEMIQKNAGMDIPQIFKQHGESFFRDIESASLKKIAASADCVIATGGGSVLRPANVEHMRNTGKIIYLETSLPVLWERVKEKQDRPLLHCGSPRESLGTIYQTRKPLYEAICDMTSNTDGLSAEEVAVKILALLEKRIL